jgi:hypothetical protein
MLADILWRVIRFLLPDVDWPPLNSRFSPTIGAGHNNCAAAQAIIFQVKPMT